MVKLTFTAKMFFDTGSGYFKIIGVVWESFYIKLYFGNGRVFPICNGLVKSHAKRSVS